MRIRRYEAKNSRIALAKIKEEMGEDAVILATKNIPDRDGSGSMVEIVAAIDYDVDNFTVPPPDSQEERSALKPPSGTYNLKSIKNRSYPGEAVSKSMSEPVRSSPMASKHPEIHSEAHDLRLRFANLLRPPQSKSHKDEQPVGRPKNKKIERKRQAKPAPQEVAVWRNQLINKIQFSPPDQYLMSGDPTIIALVGATGVGKTTTAAKLAAWYSLRQGRKVCLLSMDCYRIGATDQLRTYARIMRLPCEVVLRKPDLSKAIQRHADKLIIIDTTGKSPYDEQHIPELQEWFQPFSDIAPHLVISATTKKEDIQSVFTAYEPLNIASMVLTKLDETRAYAVLCQQIVASALPISYLCTGQRVPEDLKIASKNYLDTLFKKGWQAAQETV
jgi:flagellar biosynthesis protein FlhF